MLGTRIARVAVGLTIGLGAIGIVAALGEVPAVAQTAPVFTSANHATFTQGTAIGNRFVVTATGTPTPVLSLANDLSDTGLPSTLTFFPSSGVISGTPLVTGTYTIDVNANNGVGSVTQEFTLSVAPAAPRFTSLNHATFTVGVTGSFTVTATGYPHPKFSSSTLPSGLTLVSHNNNTATLSGSPAAGTGALHVVVLTAKSTSGTARQSLNLYVDQAPKFISGATISGPVGTVFSFTIKTTGYPPPTITSTPLPAGVTLTDHTNGTATLDGTYLAATQTITFTAANGTAPNATQVFHMHGI